MDGNAREESGRIDQAFDAANLELAVQQATVGQGIRDRGRPVCRPDGKGPPCGAPPPVTRHPSLYELVCYWLLWEHGCPLPLGFHQLGISAVRQNSAATSGRATVGQLPKP